jgi:hypothetical protein
MARKISGMEVIEDDLDDLFKDDETATDTDDKGTIEDSLVDDEGESDEVQPAEEASETSTVVAEVQATQIEWDEATERKKDEDAWMAALRNAKVMYQEAEEELSDAKENLKIAKSNEKLALSQLVRISTEGPKFRDKPTPVVGVVDAPGSSSDAPAENQDDDWRTVETATLLEGIEGLGAKKREDLLDAFPTLGSLEDARAEASKEFLPFRSKLPKGIGEKIADAIEEAMLSAIK